MCVCVCVCVCVYMCYISKYTTVKISIDLLMLPFFFPYSSLIPDFHFIVFSKSISMSSHMTEISPNVFRCESFYLFHWCCIFSSL